MHSSMCGAIRVAVFISNENNCENCQYIHTVGPNSCTSFIKKVHNTKCEHKTRKQEEVSYLLQDKQQIYKNTLCTQAHFK